MQPELNQIDNRKGNIEDKCDKFKSGLDLHVKKQLPINNIYQFLKGHGRALFISWLLTGYDPLLTAQSGDASTEFFESRIRPFLITDCQECHGPKHQRGGLRVDSREALLRGGDSGPAVVPKKAQESRLLRAIQHLEPDLSMPKERPRLPETVIRDVARWIEAGAVFPAASGSPANSTNNSSAWPRVFATRRQWWSFQTPVNPALPPVNHPNWSVHPVDRFILARLEAEGLQPAPPAEPQVWLRRVHWTLTGLPPEPAEVVAFLADPSLEARTRVVDALLASPWFGERWARHWMDLVRFADSYGHEQDYTIPHAWRYRDYLIRAFNADVPYDLFVQEHLAGDLLPSPRRNAEMGFNESILATGFWYLHQATHAPVDPLQDEADRIDTQVDVFSNTFLGLTVACARCHDHKFDAISTQDYYSISAFLRASRQDIACLDPDGTLEPRLNSRIQDHQSISEKLRPILRKALKDATPRVAPYLIQAQELLRSTIASNAWPGEVQSAARRHGLDASILDRWVAEVRTATSAASNHPLRPWLAVAAKPASTAARSNGSESIPATTNPPPWTLRPDPSTWKASGQAFRTTESPVDTWRVGSLGMEFLPGNIAHSGRWAPNLQGTLRSPTFTLTHNHLHLRVAGRSGKIRLIIARYGLREFNPLLFESTQIEVDAGADFVWRSMSSGLHRHRGRLAYLELLDDGDGFIALDQLVASDDPKPPQPPETVWNPEVNLPSPAQAEALEKTIHAGIDSWAQGTPNLLNLHLASTLWHRGLLDWGSSGNALAALVAPVRAAAQQLPNPIRSLAMTDGSAESTRVFLRGEPRTLGQPVQRRFLEAISGPEPMAITQGSGRLEWAKAITSPSNPFLHRVIVNRVWAHLFGRGLVETVDNFGALGSRPSHPELLDRLALDFRSEGGSLKRLIRTLCLTKTFAQSSEPRDPVAESRDPSNRWLHRQNLRRLEAEALRDALLATAGNLNHLQFGPPVLTHITPFMGDRMWVRNANGPLDGERRRSVYQETRRNFLSPLMVTFDLPIPDTTVGRRNQSNVPAQALTLMNDPFVRHQSSAWARRLLLEGGTSTTDRLFSLYLQAFGRTPTPAEIQTLQDLLAMGTRDLDSSPAGPDGEIRLWTEICHALFMTQEFTHVP